VAIPARKLVAEGIYGLSATGDANAFDDPSSVASADMAATVDDTQVSLHAFSYAGTHAAISQRTVNEAAAVVEYLTAP
jgi:hypothetical protein